MSDDDFLTIFEDGSNRDQINLESLKSYLYYQGYQIDSDSLKHFLEKNNLSKEILTKQDLQIIKNIFDKNNLELKNELKKSFQFFEIENSLFDIKKLKDILEEGKNKFSQNEIDELVSVFDCDHKGIFDYDDFLNKKLEFIQ